MRFPSPFSWAFLAVAGLLCAVALGAAAYWVAADDSPGLSQNAVAAGRRLVPLDEDGRVRTAARPATTAARAADDAPVRTGRAVFATECAGCHGLDAAGARGTVGPDLDVLSPSAAEVREQVRSGGGGMPAFGGALPPAEIAAVAAYVATSARPPRTTSTRTTPVTPPTVTDDHGGDDSSGRGRGKGRGGDDSSGGSGKGRGGRDD